MLSIAEDSLLSRLVFVATGAVGQDDFVAFSPAASVSFSSVPTTVVAKVFGLTTVPPSNSASFVER
eukprot:CAMPEP_0201889908 /NCGR_PEP_ID=MMETSP0902-20130614/31118_1 /ASSEMBLY_ACC=CAM_ASM_000551 /TAXON_ID=420261 /ORGANISM="Thalassiosira antarctica, Strain CCMP982" /LENGTH=65 /DNA_ID=CAMNT_0048420623 /DNA_START=213 /DNA_END=407 /DNA_ORIENTATION=+